MGENGCGGAPEILESDVKPFDELLGGVKGLLGEKEGKERVDLRLSKDPGNFMCGFIYYAGLVERWIVGEDRNVIFCMLGRVLRRLLLRRGERLLWRL